jgi:Flp pilus assembly protein TadG
MSVEMAALVFPVTVVMTVLLIAVWQLSVARLDVHTAAAAAARAASLQNDPAAAATAAHGTAGAALGDAGRTCTDLTVQVDTDDFGRGGSVAVTITCRVTTGDLVGLNAPGSVPTSATARAPVERFREITVERP